MFHFFLVPKINTKLRDSYSCSKNVLLVQKTEKSSSNTNRWIEKKQKSSNTGPQLSGVLLHQNKNQGTASSRGDQPGALPRKGKSPSFPQTQIHAA